MTKLNEIIRKVDRMPLLSRTAMQILEILGREDHGIGELTDVVSKDPGLSANILKIVNSAAFGLRDKVSSLERAINFLGDKMVAGIAISQSSGKVYQDALAGYGGEAGLLWDHSIRTAMAARELAGLSGGRVNPDVAYTAGLLHDIGKAVISEYLADTVPAILASIDSGETPSYLEAERRELGTDHAEIGAALAEHWNLPPQLVDVIRFHHRPADTGPQWIALAYVVHLADIVAMLGGTGTGADTLMYPLDSRYETYLEITGRDLEGLILKVADEYERTKPLFDN